MHFMAPVRVRNISRAGVLARGSTPVCACGSTCARVRMCARTLLKTFLIIIIELLNLSLFFVPYSPFSLSNFLFTFRFC